MFFFLTSDAPCIAFSHLLKHFRHHTRSFAVNLQKCDLCDVFIVDFKHISDLVPVFLLLTLDIWLPTRKKFNFKAMDFKLQCINETSWLFSLLYIYRSGFIRQTVFIVIHISFRFHPSDRFHCYTYIVPFSSVWLFSLCYTYIVPFSSVWLFSLCYTCIVAFSSIWIAKV